MKSAKLVHGLLPNFWHVMNTTTYHLVVIILMTYSRRIRSDLTYLKMFDNA